MARTPFKLGILAALATTSAALVPAAANAQYYGGGSYQQVRHRPDRGGYDADRSGYYGGGYGGSSYGRGYYARGRTQHRYRCDRGTGGTIIGAIAGGLLGNSIAGYGDRTAGTVVGAGVGALAGRAIDRDC